VWPGKVNIADKLYLVIELVRLDSPATPSALAFPFLLTEREVFPWTESLRREKTPAQGRVVTPSVPGSCARTRKVTSTAAGQTGETAALLNRRGHILDCGSPPSKTSVHRFEGVTVIDTCVIWIIVRLIRDG
jgi:hypothetical protein